MASPQAEKISQWWLALPPLEYPELSVWWQSCCPGSVRLQLLLMRLVLQEVCFWFCELPEPE